MIEILDLEEGRQIIPLGFPRWRVFYDGFPVGSIRLSKSDGQLNYLIATCQTHPTLEAAARALVDAHNSPS